MANRPNLASARKHEVETFVYIEQAVKPNKLPQLKESFRDAQRKVIYENPVANHHFHLEYQLFPGLDHAVFKTDVIVYGGVVAKVFTDADAKVITTWEADGLVWYGWAHKHKFKVTLEDLLDLYQHSVQFTVWNTKDRFSVKAKYDHPKAFRLPADGRLTSLSDGLSVTHLLDDHPSHLRKFSCVYHSVSPQKKVKDKKRKKAPMSSDSEAERVTESPDCDGIPQTVNESEENEHKDLNETEGGGESHVLSSSKKLTKAEMQEIAEQQQILKEGLLQLNLNWSDVFGKNTLTTVRSVAGRRDLEETRVTLHLRTDLMPEEWRRELCPATITIESAHSMPSTPLSYVELQERCKPAYVNFHFLNKPSLRTSGVPQGSTLRWNEARVLLLGTIDRGILLEYLRGPLLVLEVHDRDLKENKEGRKPALFGSEQGDSVLGTTAFMAGSSLRHNPFCGGEDLFNPYGVATIDLSELLNGQTYHEFTSQIQRGPRRPAADVQAFQSVSDLPPGDYISCGSVLKLKVELTYPLTLENNDLLTSPRNSLQCTISSCPFIRGVYLLSGGKKGASVLGRLLNRVTDVNLSGLCLDEMPEDVQMAALSTYKLTSEEMEDHELDIITGFQVSDGERHIVVLEGLKKGGMEHLWETLPHNSTQDEGILRVLWNSAFQFSKRMYGELDVDISCIRLHKPLSHLVQQSGVYVQDGVPEASFEALMALNELTRTSRLSDAVKSNLLPSVGMVIGLSTEFGIPATFEDLALCGPVESDGDDGKTEQDGEKPTSRSVSFRRTRRRRCLSLDNHNPWYESLLDERKNKSGKNFIKSNIVATGSGKSLSAPRRPHSVSGGRSYLEPMGLAPPPLPTAPPTCSGPVFNYSTQSLNSTEQSQEMLRRKLAQDPAHRYTYSQHYHSMTVVPVNTTAAAKLREEESKRKWLTSEGFRYPSVPSSLSSNAHPKHPHKSRVDDLAEPFEDNLLHWNKMKPSVERVHFPWEERKQNFESYTRPPVDFGVHHPMTIHLAGDSRKKELGEFLDEEKEKWSAKLVVSDTRFRGLRRSLKTEQTSRGRKASNQLEKLQGLLKDPAQKQSLKGHTDLPALSTLHSFGLSGQQDSNIVGDQGVGYQPGRNRGSLKVDRNVFPIASGQ